MRTARLLVPAFVLLAGCGTNPDLIGQKINRTPLDPAAQEQHKQEVAAGDAAWAGRVEEAKLREAIEHWEKAVAIKNNDHETYAKLSRAYYFLADGFLFFDEAKRAEFLATHEKGQAVAEQGLRALSADFEKRRNAGTKIEDAVMKLGREAVPLMYWFDVNLGKWAKAQDISTTLKHKDRIFKIMSRVYELDPDYFYGAPDRYFGSYYAVAPSFAGGDLEKSNTYFQQSLKKAPNYLATHVLIAEVYAPKVSDRELYERELKFVLDTPANIIPELEPEHVIEKKKAEKLLAEIDDKF